MGSFQEAEWSPTFPEPRPPHWVALVAGPTGIGLLSDCPISRHERVWLREWLATFLAVRPDELEASYVYLGLAHDWSSHPADGKRSSAGVTGVGSGIDLGAPPGSVPSTTVKIIHAGLDALAEA